MIATLGGITLPEDMRWINEYSPAHASTSRQRAISGKQVISRSVPVTGKSIILRGGTDYGWMQLSTLQSLIALYEQNPPNDPPHTLIINGVSRYVLFEDAGIEAEPIMEYNTHEATDWFVVALKLYTLTLDEQPVY